MLVCSPQITRLVLGKHVPPLRHRLRHPIRFLARVPVPAQAVNRPALHGKASQVSAAHVEFGAQLLSVFAQGSDLSIQAAACSASLSRSDWSSMKARDIAERVHRVRAAAAATFSVPRRRLAAFAAAIPLDLAPRTV